MALLFSKIWRTGIVTEDLGPGRDEPLQLARAIEERTRLLLGRSLAIRGLPLHARSTPTCVGTMIPPGA